MPKLPRISGDETIRILKGMGFEYARQQGSHVVLRKETPEGVLGCVVPLHRELAVGTLRNILRQAGVTPEEFTSAL